MSLTSIELGASIASRPLVPPSARTAAAPPLHLLAAAPASTALESPPVAAIIRRSFSHLAPASLASPSSIFFSVGASAAPEPHAAYAAPVDPSFLSVESCSVFGPAPPNHSATSRCHTSPPSTATVVAPAALSASASILSAALTAAPHTLTSKLQSAADANFSCPAPSLNHPVPGSFLQPTSSAPPLAATRLPRHGGHSHAKAASAPPTVPPPPNSSVTLIYPSVAPLPSTLSPITTVSLPAAPPSATARSAARLEQHQPRSSILQPPPTPPSTCDGEGAPGAQDSKGGGGKAWEKSTRTM
jgi:hypothetical protein